MSKWRYNPNYYSPEERKAYGEAMRQREREQDQEKAAKHAVIAGLPNLEGSEAQIAWANVIRYDVLKDAIGSSHGLKKEFFEDTWESIPGIAEKIDSINAIVFIREKVTPILKNTSAKFWIDNKETLERIDAVYVLTNWGAIYNNNLAEAARQEKVAEIKKSKPAQPECLKKIFDKYEKASWNLVVYGKEKYGYRIYVNGDEYNVSSADAELLKNYIKTRTEWFSALEAAEKGI